MSILDAMRTGSTKSISLILDNGVNEKGEALTVSKSFSNIRNSATDADILNSGNILGSLIDKPLEEIQLVERTILVG